MRKIIITCLMVTAIFVNSVYAADTPLIERVDTAVNNYDENIDISDAAIELQGANMAYEAALMATGKILQTSLVNYL